MQGLAAVNGVKQRLQKGHLLLLHVAQQMQRKFWLGSLNCCQQLQTTDRVRPRLSTAGESNCSLPLRFGPRCKPRTAFMVAVSAAMPHRSMFCISIPAQHLDSSDQGQMPSECCRNMLEHCWRTTWPQCAMI